MSDFWRRLWEIGNEGLLGKSLDLPGISQLGDWDPFGVGVERPDVSKMQSYEPTYEPTFQDLAEGGPAAIEAPESLAYQEALKQNVADLAAKNIDAMSSPIGLTALATGAGAAATLPKAGQAASLLHKVLSGAGTGIGVGFGGVGAEDISQLDPEKLKNLDPDELERLGLDVSMLSGGAAALGHGAKVFRGVRGVEPEVKIIDETPDLSKVNLPEETGIVVDEPMIDRRIQQIDTPETRRAGEIKRATTQGDEDIAFNLEEVEKNLEPSLIENLEKGEAKHTAGELDKFNSIRELVEEADRRKPGSVVRDHEDLNRRFDDIILRENNPELGETELGVKNRFDADTKDQWSDLTRKSFDERAYPVSIKVRVEYPDQTFYDVIDGLNVGHALSRARDNWGGAKITSVPFGEKGGAFPESFKSEPTDIVVRDPKQLEAVKKEVGSKLAGDIVPFEKPITFEIADNIRSDYDALKSMGKSPGNIGLHLQEAYGLSEAKIEEVLAGGKRAYEKRLADRQKIFDKSISKEPEETGIVLEEIVKPEEPKIDLPDETAGKVEWEKGVWLTPDEIDAKVKDAGSEKGISVLDNDIAFPPEPPEKVTNKALTVPEGRKFHLDFKEWVNNRAASDLSGQRAYKLFEPLKSQLGMHQIMLYQNGNLNNPSTAKLKAFTDHVHETARKAGIDLGKVENYVPQYWNETPEQILSAAQAAGINVRRMGLKPGFAMNRVFPSYKVGIQAGLTPKFDNIADIMNQYARDVNHAVSNQGFWNWLKDTDQISARQFDNSKYLDPELFPNAKGKAYWASNELADKINNYLRPGIAPLREAASKVSDVKNVVMSSGVPFTGINAHGFSIVAANAFASKNPLAGFIHAMKYLVMPSFAEKSFKANINQADRLMRSGLTATTEEHLFKPGKGLKEELAEVPWKEEFGYKKLRKLHEVIFENPLFQKAIPALKVELALKLESDNLASGMSKSKATDQAVHKANEIFGGINWAEEGRSKNVQNIARIAFNAPDWLESQVRVGTGVVKALKNPNSAESKFYLRVMKNVLGVYVLGNVVNKITSDKYMIENQPGQEGLVAVGETENEKKLRMLKPAGTRADFVKIPHDIVLAMYNNEPEKIVRILSYRLSIPLNFARSIVGDRDWKGDPILGKDRYGRTRSNKERAKSILDQAIDLGGPQYIQGPYKYFTQDEGEGITPEEAISRSIELPFNFPYKKKPKGLVAIEDH